MIDSTLYLLNYTVTPMGHLHLGDTILRLAHSDFLIVKFQELSFKGYDYNKKELKSSNLYIMDTLWFKLVH